MNDEKLTLYPPWKQALAELELAGIEPGNTIEKQWLEERFGLKPALTIADAEKNRLLFRTLIWQLRNSLLHQHRLMLRAVGGVGYRVVEVEDQTSTALRDRGEAVTRELNKLMEEISYVRLEVLTDAGRKANSDAIAKISSLQGMAIKKLGFRE